MSIPAPPARQAKPAPLEQLGGRALALLLTLLSAACGQNPTHEAMALAAGADAHTGYITGTTFSHLLVTRIPDGDVEQLSVYLGGDGRAFIRPGQVSLDPTPRHHLGLNLMLADPGPAAYIGRPCYYSAAGSTPCEPSLWTTSRYSREVRDSIAAVVADLAGQHPEAAIRLIGFSGGGTLAMLVAAVSPAVVEVVTLAAPLDTQRWTELHGYSPLTGSLNPADQHHWRPGLRQSHYFGEHDKNVPAALASGFIRRLQATGLPVTSHTVSGFDHSCCWLQAWPALAELKKLPQDQQGGDEQHRPGRPFQGSTP
ncbi:alpha/beta hydrolase family protein [Pseudohalioglobus lutimaris]|uniref:Alpha/beta hydrolase n=1 Tax=Pseudohalioglobus lutimaris TaxID=1737061 RepID=A0A2N5X2B7_9GAMM|nr:alpha/beta hydrolase [Pseudohalioglobus lutimaris]PLW68637.1 alpha/beta hydrolase [Pseudohalioglobus lutimaris]